MAGEAETRALVDKLIDEEILFREALSRGFEQSDRSIAYRLAQKMEYLGEDRGDEPAILYHRALEMGLHRSDPVVRRILVEKIRLIIGRSGAPPSERELAEYYALHKDRYLQAARVTFRHVFFNRSRRTAEGARQAADAAFEDAAGKGPDDARTLGGDPFVMGTQLVGQSSMDLTKLFGAGFAEETLMLPSGTWSRPVESTYGWHLVWIEDRFDSRIPELAEVRSRVEKGVLAAREEERVDEFLARMREQYTIAVDESAIRAVGNG